MPIFKKRKLLSRWCISVILFGGICFYGTEKQTKPLRLKDIKEHMKRGEIMVERHPIKSEIENILNLLWLYIFNVVDLVLLA